MYPLLSRVQSFFFEAMRDGYASPSVLKNRVHAMPGYKEIRYQHDDFLLVDRWCANPDSQKSAGSTTIWVEGVPAWVMNYGGYYPESHIPFLKLALRQTYLKGEFHGGRGKNFHSSQEGLSYVNRVKTNDFANFRGREEILVNFSSRHFIPEAISYHDYWGMSLL